MRTALARALIETHAPSERAAKLTSQDAESDYARGHHVERAEVAGASVRAEGR